VSLNLEVPFGCKKWAARICVHTISSVNVMKLVVVAAACLSAALAFPGGYIYKGGVHDRHDFKRPMDFMAAAEGAHH